MDPASFLDAVFVETSRLSFALIPFPTSRLLRFVRYDESTAEFNSGNCSFRDDGIDLLKPLHKRNHSDFRESQSWNSMINDPLCLE